jgi:hypothetical protein
MAHFAEVNEENIVTRVLVVDNSEENDGQVFLADTLGLGGTWIKTSYNTFGGVHSNGGTPLRKNYAGVGYTYDSSRDAFIPPKPYDSWLLNEDTCLWDAPTPMPVQEGKVFKWVEEDLNWQEVVIPQDEV